MIRLADYVVNRVFEEGAEHIFMVTGRGALFLTDAVAAHKKIKGISLHHEQSASFATIAYSDFNEKLGACLVSTGCAATNTITGVLNAWQDGIPSIFISGQNKLNETTNYRSLPIRTFGQQEADIIPIVTSITKYATMIKDPNTIVKELDKAIYLAKTGRKGPVWIDIPLDIQNKRIFPIGLEPFLPEIKQQHKPEEKKIRYVSEKLKQSKRPVILIGSGVRSSGAIKELESFIEKTSIPLVYANSAPDSYGTKNEMSIGSVGAMGCSRSGNFTVQNSDFLLILGCKMTTMTTGEQGEKFARDAKIIVVDIDENVHLKENIRIDQLIISDIKLFLTRIMHFTVSKVSEKWIKKCLHWKIIFPKKENNFNKTKKVDLYFLSECLSKALPDDSVFLSDSGLIELILPTNINFGKNQRCIHPSSQGSMGYALPALIGAYFSSNRPIIAVIGDGSIMMNLQELETIGYHKIPAKIFVINNNVYSVIRKRQVDLFRTRTIGVDPSDGISCPSFKKVAKAFEIEYKKINNNINLMENIKTIMNIKGPIICEVLGEENQNYISNSYAKNKKKRIVNRSLEDQSPFLDREFFLSEMVIEAIDQ